MGAIQFSYRSSWTAIDSHGQYIQVSPYEQSPYEQCKDVSDAGIPIISILSGDLTGVNHLDHS